MDPNSEEVEQDLSHIHWSWPEAIAANPARSLATPDLAMDYFAYSPFWDSKSNNNVLRTQRRIENPTYGHAEEKVELQAMNDGFEYIVAHSAPPDMFIIHKREVVKQPDGSVKRDRVSAIYWILREKVYPSPTLYEVVSTRMKNAAFLVSNTFSTLSALHPPSNPRSTNQWRSLPPDTTTSTGISTVNDDRHRNAGASNAKAGARDDDDVEMGDGDNAAGRKDNSGTGKRDKGKEGEKGQAGSVEVGTGSGIETGGNGNANASNVRKPDWHLFHALQATRASLDQLDKMARSAPPEAKLEVEARSTGRGISNQRPGPMGGATTSIGAGSPALSRLGVGVGTPGTVSSGVAGGRRDGVVVNSPLNSRG